MTNKAGHDAVYEAEANGKETVVEWLLTEGRGLDTGLKWSVEVDGAERSGASGMEEEVEGMDVVGQAD